MYKIPVLCNALLSYTVAVSWYSFFISNIFKIIGAGSGTVTNNSGFTSLYNTLSLWGPTRLVLLILKHLRLEA